MHLEKFLQYGINVESVKQYQIIFLPENYGYTDSKDKLQDAINSIDLFKALKGEGVSCATIEDFGITPSILDRWSDDKWFGTVYIRDKVMIPILTSAISGLIVYNVTTQKTSEKIIPPPEVHIELKIENDSTITSLKYDGDGETLVKILKEL